MESDLLSLFKTGFVKDKLQEYFEEIGYRLVGGLKLIGFHFKAKLLSNDEVKQCHSLITEVLDIISNSPNTTNPFVLFYCQDILSNRVYVLNKNSGDLAEYKGFNFVSLDDLIHCIYLPISFVLRTKEEFFNNFFINEGDGSYHKIECVKELKKELLRAIYTCSGEIIDTGKLLNLRKNSYLNIIYQNDTQIRTEEDSKTKTENDILVANMTLCIYYKKNIMFYELIKFLLQDFIRSLYCRIGEGEQRKLPKRILCRYNTSLFSLYSFGDEIKVCLKERM